MSLRDILQSSFIGTVTVRYDCPSAIEETLKNMCRVVPNHTYSDCFLAIDVFRSMTSMAVTPVR